MDSVDGTELLLDVGLDRRVLGGSEVEITTGDDRSTRWRVLLLRHSPSPEEIRRALAAIDPARHEGVYFVVHRAGAALSRAAREDPRVAFGAVDQGLVSVRGEAYRVEDTVSPQPARGVRSSWARMAALRVFALTSSTLTQSAIARLVGLSHVAVRKQLPKLEGLAERTDGGWCAADRAACWDAFIADYSGPGGLASYWTALGDGPALFERMRDQVDADGDEIAFSGDFGADFYAAWRRPARVVGYAVIPPDLRAAGFAEVGAGAAAVELRTPADPTVLALARAVHDLRPTGSILYVDPVLIAWDLLRTGGSDADEAVEHLRARVLGGDLWV